MGFYITLTEKRPYPQGIWIYVTGWTICRLGHGRPQEQTTAILGLGNSYQSLENARKATPNRGNEEFYIMCLMFYVQWNHTELYLANIRSHLFIIFVKDLSIRVE